MKARFIPAKALASREAFASYMTGGGSFSPTGTVTPYISEDLRRDPWVWFGTDNLWPQRALELIDNCIPLSRCVDTSKLFIAGHGVRFVDEKGEPIEKAQKRFQEWVSESSEEEFMERIAHDVAALNAFAVDVTPLKGGQRIGRIRHRDVSRIRLEKADEMGRIANVYWSPDWTLAMRKSRNAAARSAVPVAKPYLDLKQIQPIAVAYVKAYKQGKDYYGEPWWISAWTDAENHVEVGRFNNSQLKNGFRAAIHLHYVTDKSEKELDTLYEDLRANYMGSMGEGVFITTGVVGEEAKVVPIERGDHAGELDTMREKAERAIVKAYGLTDVFYGLDAKSGMDGASAALQQAVEQWQRTWVEPRQRLITRELTKWMNADGIEVWDTIIEPVRVVDPKSDEVQDRQAYMRAVKVNEHRVNRLGMEELKEGGDVLLIAAGASPDPAQQPA